MADSAESVAHDFVRAINRQDEETLAELMAEDHCFVDSLGNTVSGRTRMQAGWAAYFLMVPDYSIAVTETYSNGSAVVMLGLAHGTFAPDGNLKPENHWETPAAFRARIEGGKVVEWRVYADNDPIRQRMAKAQH